MDLPAYQIGDNFLVGRAETTFPLMPVGKAQELRPVFFPPSRLFPEISWLHHGHEQFLGTGPIHLLAHNLFNLADGSKPQREIRIYPGCQLADKTCPQEEAVAHHLCFCRCFLQGGQQQF